jgi:hypothetical protein
MCGSSRTFPGILAWDDVNIIQYSFIIQKFLFQDFKTRSPTMMVSYIESLIQKGGKRMIKALLLISGTHNEPES